MDDVELDLIKTEAQELSELFRAYVALLIQVATVLAVADVTVIGYAFSNQWC